MLHVFYPVSHFKSNLTWLSIVSDLTTPYYYDSQFEFHQSCNASQVAPMLTGTIFPVFFHGGFPIFCPSHLSSHFTGLYPPKLSEERRANGAPETDPGAVAIKILRISLQIHDSCVHRKTASESL